MDLGRIIVKGPYNFKLKSRYGSRIIFLLNSAGQENSLKITTQCQGRLSVKNIVHKSRATVWLCSVPLPKGEKKVLFEMAFGWH